MSLNVFWCLVLIIGSVIMTAGGILDKRQHQTNASLEKMNDLTCFQCSTMSLNDNCGNLTSHNSSLFHNKCKGDKKTCMVKRYSYTTSNENSTSHIKMWSMERSCTNKCENGCIIIGERTKLYACTACCYTNLCNISNNCTSLFVSWRDIGVFLLVFLFNVFDTH